MILSEMSFNSITNDIFKDGNHFITIYMDAVKITGIPKVMEIEKCVEWRYFDMNDLPKKLFLPYRNFILGKKYRN